MSTEDQAVRFAYSEWSDPLRFTVTPSWLTDALNNGRVEAHFGGEDYWYLKVQTEAGIVQIGPGQEIQHHNGSLSIPPLG